jgi:hypothetical protein
MADLFDETPETPISVFAMRRSSNSPSQPSLSDSLPKLPPPPSPVSPSPPQAQPVLDEVPSNPPPQTQRTEDHRPKPVREIRQPRRMQVMKQKDLIKLSLNRLQTNIESRFQELTEIIESLKPQSEPHGAVLTNDRIMRGIQSAIVASEEKDRILREKQMVIGSMNYSLTEREERANLRKQLSAVMEDLAAEMARFTDADNDYEFRVKEIKRLKTELAELSTRTRLLGTRLRNQIDNEIIRVKKDFEESQKSGSLKIGQFNQEIKEMREKTTQFLHENERMLLSVPKVTESDLDRAKGQLSDKLKEILRDIVTGVNEMMGGALEQGKSYSGEMVTNAMRTALQRVAEHVLNEEEDEDD